MEYKRPPLGRLTIIQFSQEVFTMTSWAVQPSSWGNELKANAEFGHSFDRIQDIALDWATDQMEAMTIWKVGTVAEFKWMEVNA